MKQINGVILVGVVLLAIVGVASAFAYSFQDPDDLIGITVHRNDPAISFPSYIYNDTGGRSYIECDSSPARNTWISNANAEATTYAAITYMQRTSASTYPFIQLWNSGGSLIGSAVLYNATTYPCVIELRMSGTTPIFYINGVRTVSLSPLATNPYYVSFGSYGGTGAGYDHVYIDNYIYGSLETGYVYDMPRQNYYIIKKSFLNPAERGFCFSNGTVINSNYMWSTWSKSNGLNESIYFQNQLTSNVYGTAYTGTVFTDTKYWDLDATLFGSSAPYGWYHLSSSNTTDVIPSDIIQYVAGEATVSWDKTHYVTQETANINYNIALLFWNTTNYTYRMSIRNPYGEQIYTTPLAVSSGTVPYTFAVGSPQGVYSAALYVTDRITLIEYLLAYNVADLTQYVSFDGYVTDEAGNALAGAYVNTTQGVIGTNATTLADGSYNMTSFLAGANITMISGYPGHTTDEVTFIPPVARSITRNITLITDPPPASVYGTVLGGLIRKSPYYLNVPSATVYMANLTTGYNGSASTNLWGYYQKYVNASTCFNITVATGVGYTGNSSWECTS